MSDSDSDLAVSVYDPEDNPNFYGSPVERDDLSECEVEESPSTAQATNVAVATTSTGNIDSERTQVKRVFIFCIHTIICISFNLNIYFLYLFRSFAVVRIHAVDVAEGRNVLPLP